MPYIIDRFEDHDLAVLETDDGTTVAVPRTQIPSEARAGDVLVELNSSDLDGEVRYAVDFETSEQRKKEATELRDALPTVEDGDLEL